MEIEILCHHSLTQFQMFNKTNKQSKFNHKNSVCLLLHLVSRSEHGNAMTEMKDACCLVMYVYFVVFLKLFPPCCCFRGKIGQEIGQYSVTCFTQLNTVVLFQ